MDRRFRKLLISGIVGIALGIAATCSGYTVHALWAVPIYVIGMIYGIGSVLPALGRFAASMMRGTFNSVLFRRALLAVFLLLLLPVGIAFLLAVGWIIGIVRMITEVSTAARDADRQRVRTPRRVGRPQGDNPFSEPAGRTDDRSAENRPQRNLFDNQREENPYVIRPDSRTGTQWTEPPEDDNPFR